MNAYLEAERRAVVEASAITGAGVTATLRAAVTRILDNLKNNVDTTLDEAPALAAPDMSAKSGVTQHSAGTPKLSMKSGRPAAPRGRSPCRRKIRSIRGGDRGRKPSRTSTSKTRLRRTLTCTKSQRSARASAAELEELLGRTRAPSWSSLEAALGTRAWKRERC